MADHVEIPTLEGLLCWDGRVLELFRSDGRQGHWRLHGRLVDDVEVERRKDRFLVKFVVTKRFYESAEVALDHEAQIGYLVASIGASG